MRCVIAKLERNRAGPTGADPRVSDGITGCFSSKAVVCVPRITPRPHDRCGNEALKLLVLLLLLALTAHYDNHYAQQGQDSAHYLNDLL